MALFKKSNDSLYNDAFYTNQIDSSLASAEIYCEILSKVFKPKSIIDVGCGRGAWLKSFGKDLSSRIVGIDGPWNAGKHFLDSRIKFISQDLNLLDTKMFTEKFDLAISVEVAEHLLPDSSERFIGVLTSLSDVIIFGAAYPGQGGTGHLNEKPQSYWASIFRNNKYEVFDLFRPQVWGNDHVLYWYQQNTFLYVNNKSNLFNKLLSHGILPVSNLAYLNCIHPDLYRRKNDVCNKLKLFLYPTLWFFRALKSIRNRHVKF
jgi:hypothetical protein